jgi:signal transduction histidine kinase
MQRDRNVSRELRLPWLVWGLGLLTIVILITFAGHPDLSFDPRVAIAMIGLVAFLVIVEVPLQNVGLSLGYPAGLLTLLILGTPEGFSFVALMVIALGGLSGGILRTIWRYRESRRMAPGLHWSFDRLATYPIFAAAQLTISLFLGQVIYTTLSGNLPLTTLHPDDVWPVFGLIASSMFVYLAFFSLMLWMDRISSILVVEHNLRAIILTMLLPLPLVIACAVLYWNSLGAFTLLTGALIGLAFAATELGRAELRYKQQVAELRSLSAMNRAMRVNLDLDALIQVIHLQVSALVECDYFLVALFDPALNRIELPLAIRHGMRYTPEAFSPDSVVRHVIDTKAPLLFSETPALTARNMKLSGVDARFTSWLAVPIVGTDRALGAMVMANDNPDHLLGEHELRLLAEIVDGSSTAIENALQYRQTDAALKRRMDQITSLTAINKEMSSTLTLSNVFKLVMERAIANTGSLNGVLLMRSERDNMLHTVVQIGVSLSDEQWMKEPIVEETDRSVAPTRIVKDGHIQLGVPIVRQFDVLGIIFLESADQNAYQIEDITFVMQLATQSTIAFDNIRLIEWMMESRNRLQVILDSMQEAVIMFDIEGQITLANPRVRPLLGLSPEQISGQRVARLIEQRELLFAERIGLDDETLCALFINLKDPPTITLDRATYQITTNRTFFIDRTSVPVVDNNSGVIMGLLMVFSDRTEERELANAREDLSRMIVHDLRSPLTAVSTSMKLLNEVAPAETSVGKLILRTTDVSQRALRKILGLVDSLLDIAKIESGTITLDIESIALRPLAENVKIELSPLAEELNIQVDVIIPAELKLAIDHEKIERVLLNLMDNALKFTPTDGLIQVRTTPAREPDRVRVEVVDTGPGIPDDAKGRIFDRFEQVENSKGHRRGTGLGLTFCRLTVEAHGGQIWIEDNPAGGSIFVFTLPTALETGIAP